MADVSEDWTDDATDDLRGDDEIAVDDAAVDDVADDGTGEIAEDTGDGIPDEPEVFAEELQAEQALPAVDMPAVDVPETGEPRVDEVLGKLAGIEGRPTTEHVGVYDEVHRGLQDALANLDQG